MTQKNKNEYLTRLRHAYDSLSGGLEKAIFFELCRKYQQFLKGDEKTKNVTKEELLVAMVNGGHMKQRRAGKLPDDRPIRKAARQLTKSGYPVLSTCSQAGYYIADEIKEVAKPREENRKKAISALSVQKGYDKMIGFMNGQIKMLSLENDSTVDFL